MKIVVRRVLFIAVLFITCMCVRMPEAHAATLVSTDITSDTSWTLAGSPYVLTKQITIPAGVTLTIDAGVTVTHQGDFHQYYNEVGLLVRGGTLVVRGSRYFPVCITDISIGVEAHGTAEILNAEVMAVIASQSSVTITQATLGSLVASGSSTISANDVAITGLSEYPTTISSNSVLTMQRGTIHNPNSAVPQAISFLGSNGTLTETVITSASDGVKISVTLGHSVTLNRVLIRNCAQAGVRMVKDPGSSEDNNFLYLLDSEIAANGYGLHSDGRPTIVTNRNSIHHNTFGVSHTGPGELPFVANWWGDKTGPYNAQKNPNGKGNAVTDNVLFSIWLFSEPFPPKVIVDSPQPEPEPEPAPIPEPEPTPDPTPMPEPQPDPVPEPVPEPEPAPDPAPAPVPEPEPEPAPAPEPDPEPEPDLEGDETPTPEDIPLASGGPQLPPPVPRPSKTPVLLVPGLLGTELGMPGTKLWLDLDRAFTDLTDHFMDPLRFTAELNPFNPSVGIEHIIVRKDALAGLASFDYSDSLLRELEGRGYVRGTDLFDFPYDWRHGVSSGIVQQLADRIAYIRMQTGAEKVDVVAHSMGGLIVKRYVQVSKGGSGIGKAVFVGVPDIGAPKTLKTLIQGDTFGIPFLVDAAIRKIAQHMPALYDLAPSAAYYDVAGSYFRSITQDVRRIVQDLSKRETEDLLARKYGANRIAMARSSALHDSMLDEYDMRTAGVDVYSIIGCKAGTFGGIAEIKTSEMLGDIALGFGDLKEVPGDGTVPMASASHLPVDPSHQYWALKSDHARMLGQEGIRQQIANILSGGTASVLDATISQDSSKCGLNGRLISIFSPLSISIVDAAGNHAKLAEGASIENTIPNADYVVFGDHTFVYLPTDEEQSYTINLVGTGEGSFTLTDAVLENSQTVSTHAFTDIPVSQRLKGSLILGTPSVLVLDTDGDGVTDRTLESEGAVLATGHTPEDDPTDPPQNAVTRGASEAPIQVAGDLDESVLAPQVQAAAGQSEATSPHFGLIALSTVAAVGISLIARRKYMAGDGQ